MWEALVQWLESAYGLEAIRCTEVLTRPRNTLARIESHQGAFWLRVATGERTSIEDAEAEAAMVAWLAGRGVRVAAPYRFADRYARMCTAFEHHGAALLFHEAEGVHVSSLGAAHAEALGELVARMHGEPLSAACRARARRIDFAFIAGDPLDRVDPWLQAHGFDPAPLRAIADAMKARVDWDAVVLCHGDVHAGNARFAGAAPTLFDFEAWGMGPAAYDAACFWKKHVHADDDPVRAAETWAAFLRGYGAVRTWSDLSIRSVPALATLRAIWVMGLPAAEGARWGHDWLRDRAYFADHIDDVLRLAQARLARS